MPARNPRRAALLGAIAVAAALLVSSGAGWMQARHASDRLVQATAVHVRAGVGSSLRGEVPTDELLAEVLDDWSDVGLRALVWEGPDGQRIEAGPADELPPLRGLLEVTPSEPGPAPPLRSGDRVRLVQRPRPERRRNRPRRGRALNRGSLALSIEPVDALALESTAVRTLSVGAASAVVLLLFAAVLGRQWLAADRLESERAAERHLAMLGTMSAVLGHEIKNPLASLKGNAQLLLRKLDDPDHVRKAQRVVDEAQRLESLTNRILAFARDAAIERVPTDVAALLEGLLTRLDDPDVSLEAEGLTPFPLDPQWVEQAVENLVRNARQASAPRRPVMVSASRSGHVLRITVDDDGPGIPPERRQQVLEPFHTDKTQGTGLGLALVQRVAEKHGGRVEIGDSPAGGARVSLLLRDA